jgi:protein-S-isoprenylcysteine O-methyltransferase Ste14
MLSIFLDSAVNLTCISLVAQYFWSTRVHFVTGQKTKEFKLLFALVATTSFVFTVGLWRLAQPPAAQYAALAVLLASDALFWWAIVSSRQAKLPFIFDADNPVRVWRSGVYALIRHPFYSSYILFWAGWALAVWHPLAALPAALFLVVYTVAARNEERVFLASPVREDYACYMERAGRFIPRLC